MVTLCRNRPEGFGPSSALHPRLPTTCFLDVIVEPLATWIFLLLAVVLLFAVRIPALRAQRRDNPSFSFRPNFRQNDGTNGGETSEGHGTSGSGRPGILNRIASVLYYLLIVAMLAMVSLEISRLVVAQLGIGLLPFTYVGLLVALANHLTWKSRIARLANVLYWVMLAAAMALKTAAEQEEQMGPDIRVKGASPQGMYPSSDEVIDNAVMVGVEVALAGLEFVGWGRLGSR